MRIFLSVNPVTGNPGTPLMDEANTASVATMSLIETSRRCRGIGFVWARPRFPSRTKMGARTSRIVIFETATRSMAPPSTISSETPDVARRPGQRLGELKMLQLLNTMSLKPPLLSVPSFNALHAEVSTQLVTVTCSVARKYPNEGLALGTIASSHDSMKQLAMRTWRQESGSIPSQYPLRMVTPVISTKSQPSRLML